MRQHVHPDDASRQLDEIRQRMASSQTFRGFAPCAVALSGALALIASLLQPHVLPGPPRSLDAFITLWMLVASLGLASACVALAAWLQRAGSELAWRAARHVLGQVVPSLLVGAIVTWAIQRYAPDVGWMLPGLWSLLFSLAVFAARPLLSREVTWVGIYYVAAGLTCLVQGGGEQALAPWQMAVCFGGGQLLGAAVLSRTVERVA